MTSSTRVTRNIFSVATALADELPSGEYGMGTYRAAATWQDYVATRP
jgi:hypothetical protein